LIFQVFIGELHLMKSRWWENNELRRTSVQTIVD
jgi:hypothetical protein